jgi:GT2 family glycosyltransferase
MTGEFPTVSIVVLNWNGKGHLEACLKSLLALDYPESKLQIVLCDNGSTDGSTDFVRERFPTVTVVALDHNYGFAEGNNRAARSATGEWVGFLNNDMWLEPPWLRNMLAPLDAQPKLSCIASRIMNWDGSAIDFVGGGVSFHGHGYQVDHGELTSTHDVARRLLFACGGAMLIRRELFLEIGGFDPAFFAFFEDVDLGWRLNVMGHDVWYTPEATAYHRHHGTANRIEPHQITVLFERNALSMIYKCFDDDNLAAALPAALLLVNERGLELAGLDVKQFGIPGDADPAAEAAPQWEEGDILRAPRPGLVARGQKVLRDRGPWVLLGKALRQPIKLVVAGYGRLVARLPPRHFVVSAPALAYFVGISRFASQLESLNKKRAYIQSHRKRSDAEILPLFVDPFFPIYPDPHFRRFSRWLFRVQGLDRRFGVRPD